MRVALYARVSTNEQNCDNQLQELRVYAAQRQFQVAAEYCDRGFSGSKDRRPQLDKCVEDAKQRRFDAILVWKLDRWGRSIKHLVNSISELKEFGVDFISLRDSLDLSTPTGRLQFNLLSAFAEFERELIIERTKCGMNRAKRQGIHVGRPRAVVDIAKVKRMRAEGKTLREIGDKFDVSPALLVKRLK